jgi:hypothetical protein
MADPAETENQNILPVQALFNLDNSFNTFIGQGQPFYATVNPSQSGLNITGSVINSTTIGATTPSTGVFTNILSTTGQVNTAPTGNTDIANKQYVDAVAQGLNPKQAVKCATTADITLSGLQTIDTYTTLAGDRVLVKNQTSTPTNGIYIAASGAWTRATDMDVWAEVPGAYTVILNGSANINTGWVSTSSDTGTINVTPITFVQFSGTGTYYAGTGLNLAANTFSIANTGVTAATKGSASKTVTAAVNAQGQLTSLTDQDIAIAGTQITTGTIDSARLSGSYAGITGVGTLTSGTWNASTIDVAHGGTGATTLTGYVKGNGALALTAVANIPTTDLSGTISNAQLANSTISGVALGGSLYNLTFGSGITTSSATYNGSAAVSISNALPMVYPGAGIPLSTGTAWGTSYSTSGSGNVALTTSASLSSPTITNYIAYTPTTAPTYAEGRVFYDSTAKTLNYYNDNSQMSVNIGQEQIVRVRNQTGATIPDGSVVYVNGATGNTPTIALAIATSFATSDIIGVTTTSITNNGFGYVTISGLVNDLDTSAFTEGQSVFLSPTTAGTYTATEPTSPNYSVQVGVILRANPSNGTLLVAVQFISTEVSHIVGTLAIASGGTNATATPTAGAVSYGTGTAYAFTSAGTIGQVLTSNGSGLPTWTTPATAVTLSDDTSTATTRYPLSANATSGSASTIYTSSTKYQYVPSTGILTATGFAGSGAGLTGTATSLSIGGNAATATSATTATNIANGATGSLPYQASAGSTTLLAAGSNGQILTLAAGVPSWAAAPVTGITITDDTTTNSARYLTFTSATTGTITGQNVSSTKLQYNPSTGTTSSPNLTATGTVTGALVSATNGIVINSQTVSASYSIPSGSSAMSAGPITVASGQSVTVASGSRWVVL